MTKIFEDGVHAWLVVVGFILGSGITVLAIAVGARKMKELVDKMNDALVRAEDATRKANAISVHVSTQYAPLQATVKEIQADIKLIRQAIFERPGAPS